MNKRKPILVRTLATLILLTRAVIAQTAAPANDDIANAESIDLGKTSITVDLTASTLEAGEAPKTDQVGSVWYKWIASADGIARFSTTELFPLQKPAATSIFPALSDESIFYPWGGITIIGGSGGVTMTFIGGTVVRTGYERWWGRIVPYRGASLDQLTPIQVGPNAEFQVQAGEQITVCVEVYKSGPRWDGDWLGGDSLPDSFYFDLAPPLTNDSFSSALAVADTSAGYMEGHLLGATREADEPDLGADYFSGGSVWFHYTAATFGTVTLTPSTPVGFAVFGGSALSNLQVITKSAGPAASFFGEEGKLYHVAVYLGSNDVAGFNLGYTGPNYRLYETNIDGLMPAGGFPHFYGLRGATLLFYAKTATGWRPVEIEPIVNEAADLVIRPTDAVDGQVRVLTIDETLPSPHVAFRWARGYLLPELIGFAGQTCAVSSSTDLINWSTPQSYTLVGPRRVLGGIGAATPESTFYRVTQSYPLPPPPSGYTGGGGVIQTVTGYRGPPIPPPVPPLPSL